MNPDALHRLAIYSGLVFAFMFAIQAASHLLGERHRGRATGEPYESGIPPTGSARARISTKYFRVAMFFLVFDLEAVFMFTWAPVARELGWRGFAGFAIFAGVVLLALFYLSRTGALDWSRTFVEPRTNLPEENHHALETAQSGRGAVPGR